MKLSWWQNPYGWRTREGWRLALDRCLRLPTFNGVEAGEDWPYRHYGCWNWGLFQISHLPYVWRWPDGFSLDIPVRDGWIEVRVGKVAGPHGQD